MNKISNKIYFDFLLITMIVILYGCEKITLNSVDFDVAVTSKTVKAGVVDTFNFSGNPDFITFYSGELGHKFENKDRSTAVGVPNMQFKSARIAGADLNSLSLLVSTNFNGVYDSVNVKMATWVDITSRATLATNAIAIASGLIDLSEFLSANNPIYVAFKCKSNTSAWTITNAANGSIFNNVVANDGSNQTIADISSASWVNINFYNPYYIWKPVSASLSIDTRNSLNTENWAISKPIKLDYCVPDYGTGIKTIAQTVVPFYYSYTTPGTYTATFMASNSNIEGSNILAKQVIIIVTAP